MLDLQLENRVALITGANHGIGAATASAFAAQGAKVFLTYYRPPCRYSEAELRAAEQEGIGGDRLYRAFQQRSAETLAAQIRSQGGTAFAYETTQDRNITTEAGEL